MSITAADLERWWNFSDPAGTEKKFAEALAGPDLAEPMRIELLTQLARSQGLQRKFDAARLTLDQAEAAWLAARPEYSRGRLRLLLERGRVMNSSGHAPLSRPFFEAAWTLGRQIGEENLAIDAAHMMAIVDTPAGQLAWAERAIAAADAATDPKARNWLGPLLNNLGWTRHDAGEFEAAHQLFVRAQAFREAQGRRTEILIARWAVARALRSLTRLNEALAIQTELEAAHRADGTSDGYVQEELGELRLALGSPDAARPHFAAAYAVLSKDEWLKSGEPARLARLRELGGVTTAN